MPQVYKFSKQISEPPTPSSQLQGLKYENKMISIMVQAGAEGIVIYNFEEVKPNSVLKYTKKTLYVSLGDTKF